MDRKSDKTRTIIGLIVVAELLCFVLFLYINKAAFGAAIASYGKSSYLKPVSAHSQSSQTFIDLVSSPWLKQDSSLEKLIASGCCRNNAAIIYLNVGSKLTLPDNFAKRIDDIVNNGWTNDCNDIEETLAKNKVLIERFKQASELPECDFTFSDLINAASKGDIPVGCDGEIEYLKEITVDGKMPKYPNTRLARLIIAECKLYEKQGKLDLALDNYASLLRFARHLDQQKSVTLINKLIGILVQNSVYSSLAKYINQNELNDRQYQVLLDTLLSVKENITGFEGILETENNEHKANITAAVKQFRSDVKRKGTVDEDFYQEFLCEYDRLVNEFSQCWLAAFRENKMEKYEQKSMQFAKQVEKETTLPRLAGNFLKKRMGFEATASPVFSARIFFSGNRPSLLSNGRTLINTAVYYHSSISQLNILTAAVAVKLYKFKNGQLPDSLDVLVPEYLPELPGDPFNDFEPLKYEKAENRDWAIYSFGPDKKDNHAGIRYNKASDDKTGDIVFSSI